MLSDLSKTRSPRSSVASERELLEESLARSTEKLEAVKGATANDSFEHCGSTGEARGDRSQRH